MASLRLYSRIGVGSPQGEDYDDTGLAASPTGGAELLTIPLLGRTLRPLGEVALVASTFARFQPKMHVHALPIKSKRLFDVRHVLETNWHEENP